MKSFLEQLKQCADLVSYGKPDAEAIKAAEEALELSFSQEYREYVMHFGAASARGYEFTGITSAPHLNVVSVTTRLKNKAVVPPALYVVEEVHIDGLVIWQDAEGGIFQTIPGSEPKKIANSLAEYFV